MQVLKLRSSDQHGFPFMCPLLLLSPGEYSYLGTTLRQVSIEPMPSLLDVRQLIALYGVLPLGKDSSRPVVPFPEAGVCCLLALTVSSWLVSKCVVA